MSIQMIPLVDCSSIPTEVEEWLIENDYSTHYSHDIAQVTDDGNVFAEWLKKQGYKFKYHDMKYRDWDDICIMGT